MARTRGTARFARLIVVCCAGTVISATALGEITFEDVSREAGILGKGTTFGASWGDFDGDGRPDVWVSNHNARPALYLNRGDGTFTDVIDSVWSADPAADAHGAAWADFDNDGDQDLIEVVDVVVAENMCMGCGPNHFFVNADGALIESAGRYGLDRPPTQARTPLWLDANGDRRLDVLVMSREAPDSAGAILFEQQQDGRFVVGNDTYGVGPKEPGFLDHARSRLPRWARGTEEAPRYIQLNANISFATLVDIDADGRTELVTFGRDTHIYSMRTVPFEDITESFGLPTQTDVSDVAIADFDGDQRADIFLLHGPLPYNLSQMAVVDDQMLSGSIRGHIASIDNARALGIRFRATGNVRFVLDPEWFSVRNIAIGRVGLIPPSRTFELSSGDPAVAGMPPAGARGQGTLNIGYDPASGYWTMRNATPFALVDFAISADGGIDGFEYLDWEGFAEAGGQRLFLQRDGAFVPQETLPADRPSISCHSVVAEDFDNDMDLDLYLVCAGPATNLPNRLYENDGSGRFTLVDRAAGAEGATIGRGDVVVAADYDLDGYVDLFVTNGFDPTSPLVKDGPHELFRNVGSGNHWLEIDLEGTISNRNGVAAVVVVESNGARQRREQGGMHLHAQNHTRLHFGMASSVVADTVIVRWPSGIEQRLERVAADQILKITEPDDAP